MPRFAANLTMLFNEVGFLERFEAAERAGFTGVEYLFPYPYEPAQLAERLERHGLAQVLHNLPAGNWAAGERGIACLPERRGEFQDGVGQALRYARALRCPQLNCLAGIPTPGLAPERAEATLVENLRFAARALKAEGLKLLIEPINTRDIPGFFLNRTAQALRLIDAVGEDNLFVQYDVYHMQVMEGDLVPTLTRNLARIAHVQVADTPGRNEPGTGEINYPFVFEQLDKLGYTGWVGCEYKPRTDTVAGLGWLAPYRAR
jgi:hydroxypyruvate isomerase